jgi:predicted TIM-barrel fold metal-dependent hydrolase
MAHQVISADSHINEPPWVFDRVPARLRDRAPKMLRGADGGDGWSFDGGPPKRTLGVEAMAGGKMGGKFEAMRFDEIMPGNYDGKAHVADMARDGVDASVVYPASAIFTYIERDRELAVACMRSYNDWVLEEFQGAAPGRIVGLPLLPVDDGMDVCLAELERAIGLGARAAFIPGCPVRPYHDPYYDPLYRAVEERGVPLTFHRNFGGKPGEQDWDELVNQKIGVAGTVHRFFSATRPFSYMVYGGVFERFPRLRVVAAEVNCSWLPFWAQTMDQCFENPYYRATGGIRIERRPSECLGENLFVTVLDDDLGFKMIADGTFPRLADCSLFSTDYPHSVCLWPESRQHIARLTAGMDPATKHKVLAGNAIRLYGLEA